MRSRHRRIIIARQATPNLKFGIPKREIFYLFSFGLEIHLWEKDNLKQAALATFHPINFSGDGEDEHSHDQPTSP